MIENIIEFDLEKLSVGKLFDGGKLIISNSKKSSGRRIEAIHKAPGVVNINCFVYVIEGRGVRYKGGSEVTPEEHEYQGYMEKLVEDGQWR